MSARIIDGRIESRRIADAVVARAAAFRSRSGRPPRLAVIAFGSDPSSRIYLRQKIAAGKRLGVECTVESLPDGASEDAARGLIARLSEEEDVDGILLELPMPAGVNARRVLDAVPHGKDAEGLTTENLGRFYWCKSLREIEKAGVVVPCTADAVLRLAQCTKLPIKGRRAVVIGRSSIVGRPSAHLLTCADATVTLAHSKTKDLSKLLKTADIVVSAVGRPRQVRGAHLKKGALVIDVGVNTRGKKIVGDVEFKSAAKTAGWLTPVPGGVGPVTVACLFENVVRAAERTLG